MEPSSTPGGYRCRDCQTHFRADTPVNVSVAEYTSFLTSLRCLSCGSTDLKYGLDLTEKEDRALRVYGSEESRARNWYLHAETGLSALTIYEFFTTGDVVYPKVPETLSHLRRCIRLLEHVPSWKLRMPQMASVIGWCWLAPGFHDLTALYRRESFELEDHAPMTLARLARLTDPNSRHLLNTTSLQAAGQSR